MRGQHGSQAKEIHNSMICKACGTRTSWKVASCPKCGQRVTLGMGKSLLLIVGGIFGIGTALNECGRCMAKVGRQSQPEQHETPSASKQPRTAPSPQVDKRAPLEYGDPTVLVENLLNTTRVMVHARNVTDRRVTCTVRAILFRGDKVIGTATGNALGLAAGADRLLALTCPGLIKGHNTVKIESTECF